MPNTSNNYAIMYMQITAILYTEYIPRHTLNRISMRPSQHLIRLGKINNMQMQELTKKPHVRVVYWQYHPHRHSNTHHSKALIRGRVLQAFRKIVVRYFYRPENVERRIDANLDALNTI